MVKTAASELTLSNLEGIINAIETILGPDANDRVQNEELLRSLRVKDFNGYIHMITKLMKETPKLTIRIFCIAHLRRILYLGLDDENGPKEWTDLSSETQKLLKETLMEFFKDDKYPNTQTLVCDLIGDVAGSILTAGQEKKRLSKEATEWNEFMQALWDMIDSGNAIWIKNSLMVFAIVLELAPDSFSKKDKQILEAIKKTVKSDTEDKAKKLALELLIVLFQIFPKKFRKKSEILREVSELIFDYMVSTTEEPDAEWLNPTQINEEERTGDEEVDPQMMFGMMIIDSVIDRLGSPLVLDTFRKLISEKVLVNDWRYKYCAMISLAQLVEHMEDISEFEPVMKTILELLHHQHPKVRYAALHCIGQSAEDKRPEFQEQHGDTILPLVMKMFNDNAPRVVCHAVNVLVNLMEGFPKHKALAYVANLLDPLIGFIEKGNAPLKESTLSAIGNIAELCETSFVPYWEKAYSVVAKQLSITPNKTPYLKGLCIESSSLILLAVGKEESLKVIDQFIATMIQAQQEEMKNDKLSVLPSYIVSTWSRLALMLEDKLDNYLDTIAQSAFALTKKSLMLKEKEGNIKLTDDEQESAIVSKLTGEDKIEHVVLEKQDDKFEESHVISMIENLLCSGAKKNQNHYIILAFEVLLPFISDTDDDGVRKLTAACINKLIDAVVSGNDPNKSSFLKTICLTWFQKTIERVQIEVDCEVISSYFVVMKEVIKKAEKCLTQTQINELADLALTKLKESQEVMLAEDEDGFKDEDEENDDEDEENDIFAPEEEFQVNVADLFGSIFKVYQEEVLPLYKTICVEVLPKCFGSELPPGITKVGLFFVDNIIEYFDIELIKQDLPNLSQTLVKYTTDPDATLRHAAAYGIGVLMERYFDAPKDLCETCVKGLYDALLIPQGDEDEDDFKYGLDNIVASIGKTIKAQPAHIDLNKAIQVWMGHLPLKTDEIEGRSQHDQFVDMLLGPDAMFIIGDNGDNIEKVVQIIAEAMDTETVSIDFKKKAIQALEYLEGQETMKGLLYSAVGKLDFSLQMKLKAAKEVNIED